MRIRQIYFGIFARAPKLLFNAIGIGIDGVGERLRHFEGSNFFAYELKSTYC